MTCSRGRLTPHILILLVILLSLGSVTASAAPAPRVELSTADGTLDLARLKGQVVYVDFWASWCGPCRKSFPWLNDMQARYGKDGLKIVAINLDKKRDNAVKFLREYAPRFTVAFDPEAVAARAFAVKGMPSSYIIDRDGNVIHSHVGFRKKDTDAIEARIRSLLHN